MNHLETWHFAVLAAVLFIIAIVALLIWAIGGAGKGERAAIQRSIDRERGIKTEVAKDGGTGGDDSGGKWSWGWLKYVGTAVVLGAAAWAFPKFFWPHVPSRLFGGSILPWLTFFLVLAVIIWSAGKIVENNKSKDKEKAANNKGKLIQTIGSSVGFVAVAVAFLLLTLNVPPYSGSIWGSSSRTASAPAPAAELPPDKTPWGNKLKLADWPHAFVPANGESEAIPYVKDAFPSTTDDDVRVVAYYVNGDVCVVNDPGPCPDGNIRYYTFRDHVGREHHTAYAYYKKATS